MLGVNRIGHVSLTGTMRLHVMSTQKKGIMLGSWKSLFKERALK